MEARTFVFTSLVKNDFFDNQPIMERGGFGKEDSEIGKTKLGTVPGASWGFVPHSDPVLNKIFLDQEFLKEHDTTLNDLVKVVGFTKSIDNRDVAILEASTDQPGGDFWEAFHYNIPHISREDGGYEMTTSDPMQLLVIAGALESPYFYFEGLRERPPTLGDVKFLVTEKGKQTVGLVRGAESAGANVMRILTKMSIEKKKLVAEVSNIPFEETTDEETLENMIFNIVTKDPRQLVFGTDELYGFIMRMASSENDVLLATSLVNYGRGASMFTKDDEGWYTYSTYRMGKSYREVVEYLCDPESEDALALIARDAKEKGWTGF